MFLQLKNIFKKNQNVQHIMSRTIGLHWLSGQSGQEPDYNSSTNPILGTNATLHKNIHHAVATCIQTAMYS